MARTKANIWNRCLAIIGGPNQSSYIEDPDNDQSDQATWMRHFWEDDVDLCLREFDWRETRKYAELAAYTGSVEKADWAYIYDRPADCHIIREYTNSGDRTTTYPYEEVGQYILSDQNSGYVKYSKIMDYDAVHLFSVELANLIAAKLAVSITTIWKPEMAGLAEAKYAMAYNDANTSVGEQGYVEKTEQWSDI